MKKRLKAHPTPAADLRQLAEYVEQFNTKSVVLFGDFVADEFQYGDITRVSREAPVLILRHRETQIVPGGGANAANNLAALGAKVLGVSVVGDDAPGHALINAFSRRKIDTSGILRAKDWVTPTKTRFLAGWAHTVGQQVLRVDREPPTQLSDAVRAKLRNKLTQFAKHADAFAASDYGFGVVTPDEVARIALTKAKKLPITLDSRYQLTAYAKAGVSYATPNESELESLHHTTIGQNREELEHCGSATRDALNLRALLVTRGRDGMALFQSGQPTAHIAIHGSNQAVDVTGAGDTVLAAFTLSLACGASPLEAAQIANIAGGLVVMKRGTATVSQDELAEAIRKAAAGEVI